MVYSEDLNFYDGTNSCLAQHTCFLSGGTVKLNCDYRKPQLMMAIISPDTTGLKIKDIVPNSYNKHGTMKIFIARTQDVPRTSDDPDLPTDACDL